MGMRAGVLFDGGLDHQGTKDTKNGERTTAGMECHFAAFLVKQRQCVKLESEMR